MRYWIVFVIFLAFTPVAYAQTHRVSGIVQSAEDKSTIPGATVMLLNPGDSSTIKGVITTLNGRFTISNINAGKYLIKIQFVGFDARQIPVQVNKDVDMSNILIKESTVELDEVTITAKTTTGIQKGDTTQYNAGAFKTMRDARAQDLVEKMPNITMQDGKLQAQGEDVVQILVDGKPFFGNDVQTALQNLPAEVIKSVQVYDRKSDKALLSGFDDGEQEKTINIITKPNRRKGQFGRVTGGYGTDDRYMLGTSTNLFNEDRRITITGLSNNVNAVEYSADPNSQGESRTQDGIINTNIAGINFSDDWGEKVEISGSYMFSHRENEERSSLTRDYILSDSGQVYTENNRNTRTNVDHEIDMRLEYEMDPNNRFIMRPEISFKQDENSAYFLGKTALTSGPLNQTENTSGFVNTDYDYENSIYYGHKFKKEGRSLTVGLDGGYHTNEDDEERLAFNTYYDKEERNETLNQETLRNRTGISWEAELSYTEPIGKNGRAELEYEIGDRIDDSDKRTYDIIDASEGQEQMMAMDTSLSNTFKSEYLTQQAEIGYQYKNEKLRVQVEAEYQNAHLNNNQRFPQPFDMERTFKSILPTVRFDYEFSDTKDLEFDYDTYTREPWIGQLQSVIDNSNPLHLKTGNPDLNQSFNNRLRLRYRARNPESEQSFFVYMASTIIKDNFANNSIIAEETTPLNDDITLEKGAQLTYPVNVDGYWDFRTYVSFGQPVELIKSNINLAGYVKYEQSPTVVNDQVNFVNSSNYRARISLSSNINENVDFNISTRSSYNKVENSLRPSLSNNYFNQSTRVSYDWIIWKGFVYRLDLNHQLNTGLSEGFDNSFLLINTSLGMKVLKNQRGEISMNIYDLLKQNNNIRRNISDTYIEDKRSNVLNRYFMLTFTYHFRHFNKGTTMDDYEELHK